MQLKCSSEMLTLGNLPVATLKCSALPSPQTSAVCLSQPLCHLARAPHLLPPRLKCLGLSPACPQPSLPLEAFPLACTHAALPSDHMSLPSYRARACSPYSRTTRQSCLSSWSPPFSYQVTKLTPIRLLYPNLSKQPDIYVDSYCVSNAVLGSEPKGNKKTKTFCLQVYIQREEKK